jgi:hypothetical protein
MEPDTATERPIAASRPARPAGRRRAFGGRLLLESALIVLSVLVGLALGEWREHARERRLARDAVATFRREIEANLAHLQRAQPKHAAMAERLAAAADAPAAGGTAFDAFVASMPAEGLDNQPLRDVAWETAQTTGALRLLDYETAAQLSETYLIQRAAIQHTMLRLADRFLSPENYDPARRGPMVRAHRMMFVELAGQESYLIGVYRRALARLPAR